MQFAKCPNERYNKSGNLVINSFLFYNYYNKNDIET